MKSEIITKRKKNILLLCISCLLSTLIFPVHEIINRHAGDLCLKTRYFFFGSEQTSSSFITITIDDEDIEELSIGMSERKIFIDLINWLTECDVKTIIFDILFQENIPSLPSQELIYGTQKSSRIIFPVILKYNTKNSTFNKTVFNKMVLEPKVRRSGSPLSYNNFISPFKKLALAASQLGAINIQPDEDGISRSIPLVYAFKKQNEYIPSLVLSSLCNFWEIETKNMEIKFGSYIRLPHKNKNIANDRYLPIDESARLMINYSGPWKDSLETRPLREVYQTLKENLQISKSLFKETLVLVSDISTTAQDYSRGLFDRIYPNSGIVGNALNTILTENYLKKSDLWMKIISNLMIFLILFISIIRFKPKSLKYLLVVLTLITIVLKYGLFLFFNLLPEISWQVFVYIFLFMGSAIVAKKSDTNNQKNLNESSIANDQWKDLLLTPAIQINEQACREYEVTPAQKKLLLILQRGYTYKKTAELLGITENTVKKQISRIKEKTDKSYKRKNREISAKGYINTFFSI